MTTAIEGFIAFVVFLLILYGPWQYLVVSVVRRQLLALRDEWFDAAVEGKIRFDDDAYRELRSVLNAVIRFAHKVTWLRVAVARKALAALPPPPELKPLDDPEASTLRIQLIGRMVLILVGAMILRSPLLLVLSPVVVLISGLMAIISPPSIAAFPATLAEEVRREACLSMR